MPLNAQQINILGNILASKGRPYSPSQIASNSYYYSQIDTSGSRPFGNSRIYGDADYATQLSAIQAIVNAAALKGLSARDTAHVLAIAYVESGFNPDAAAGTTSATGLGQFIDQTGLAYGLNATTRWNIDSQASALVDHFLDNKALAQARNQGEEYYYKYHHDGPTGDYGGLDLALEKVLPKIQSFEAFINDPISWLDLSDYANFWDPNNDYNPDSPESPHNPNDPPPTGDDPTDYEPPSEDPDGPPPFIPPLFPWDWTFPDPNDLPISPLVLDLDGDGIELTALNEQGTYFDLNADGMAELTGWVKNDDGLLALDRNGNGQVDNITELFGTNIEDGFTKLRSLDEDMDGAITSDDSEWSNLRVWQDVNGDGVSQKNELKSLSELNITKIGLDATLLTGISNAGNNVTHTGSYTLADGQIRDIVDVWFDHNPGITRNRETYEFDTRAAFLPSLRGFGSLKDLHIAVSIDNTGANNLIDKLINFSTGKNITDFFLDWNATLQSVEDLLLRWAGVDQVDPVSRGLHINAQHLEFYEAYSGASFSQYGQANPGPNASKMMTSVFETITEMYAVQLIGQILSKEMFVDQPMYSLLTGRIGQNSEISSEAIASIAFAASQLLHPQDVWGAFARFIEYTKGTANLSNSELTILDQNVSALGISDFSTWDDVVSYSIGQYGHVITGNDYWENFETQFPNAVLGSNAADTLVGSNIESDEIYGQKGNDTIYGLGGHDYLDGGEGDDILIGGYGDDILDGGTGNNTFIYDHGNDVITDADGSSDVLRFSSSSGVTSASILELYRTVDDDLILSLSGGGIVVVEKHFLREGGSASAVESIVFELDAVTWNSSAFNNVILKGSIANDKLWGNGAGDKRDIIYGLEGNDFIDGESGDDTLYGGSGTDTIEGGYGNDILDGGTQDDILKGQQGSDIYIHSLGQDRIEETPNSNQGGIDAIHFGLGIQLADITMYRQGSRDLVIKINDGSSILVVNQFDITLSSIENLVFADNTIVTFSTGYQVAARGTDDNDTISGNRPLTSINDLIYALAGNDSVNSGTGDDTVYGGGGWDKVYGGDGNDTLYGEEGDDELFGEAGSDTLHGGNGIDLLNGGNGNDILHGNDSSDILIGGNNDDFLSGENGDDRLEGGNGNDTMLGGSGDDIIVDTYGGTDTIDGGDGIDTLDYSSVFYKVTVNLATGVQSDNYSTASNDTIVNIENIFTGSGQDQITGSAGNNLIRSGTGADIVYAGSGSDLVFGEAANDILHGEDGDDFLSGGGGVDTLYGGGGSDIFKFEVSSLGSTDIIGDFNISSGDKLDVSDLLYGYDELQSAIDDFVHITSSATGITVAIDRDGAGTGHTSQAIAMLSGVSSIDAQSLLENGNLIA